MCDFFLPVSSLMPPKQLEIPNLESRTVAGGQDSGCDITCALGWWLHEISDSSCKPGCMLERCMSNSKSHGNVEELTNSLRAERLSQRVHLPLGQGLHPQHKNAN